MDFKLFKHAVAAQFAELSKGQLYSTSVTGDHLWDTYLSSFPEGTNPVFRERTEHDCTCCKQFIRAVGSVVGIDNGKLVSIWNVDVGDPAYQVVANAMRDLVERDVIMNIFLHHESKAGIDKNFEEAFDGVQTWEHFFVNIPKRFVKPNAEQGTILSASRATYDVSLRGLKGIDGSAVDTVIELIEQGSLYRGEEHLRAVKAFKDMQREFNKAANKELFVWQNIDSGAGRIRNTVIGTLLVDIADGVELDRAVSSFEAKVAPMNYKRPTALVTRKMVDRAKAKIEELDLLSALDRRFAVATDIRANNVLFVDRNGSSLKQEDPFNGLASGAKKSSHVETVSMDEFLANILPKATSVEILMEGRHTANLMSLIAPADPTANMLFKWNNNFSWSYNGEVADSIKERVKNAGGNVSGDLCCRLAWFNFDDLDLHMIEPDGNEISFRNRQSYRTRGQLDVDMNAGCGRTREPVENIFYQAREKMIEGVYKLYVHNFSRRETSNVGFEAEIDCLGQVYKFAYEKAVPDNAKIIVAEMTYSHKNGLQIKSGIPFSSLSKEVWGLKTEEYQKVKLVTLSPNHWDGEGIGNKHVFFILEGCVNPDQARGFYNEFISSRLDQHRKVFEILGSKMKTPQSDNQLSGLGFSTTKKDTITLKVSGAFARVINIFM